MTNKSQRQKASGQVRHIQAAGGGRRAATLPVAGQISQESLVAGPILLRRSRGAYYSNPLIRNAVDNIVATAIGAGFVPASRHPDPSMKAAQADAWEEWAEIADYDGLTSWDGLLPTIMRNVVIDGECFMQWIGDQLHMILPEQVDRAMNTTTLPGGGWIVQGVEFSATGQRVAYHILPLIPTNPFETYAAPVRVPAEQVVHVFHQLAPGQVRGLPWTTASLLSAAEYDAATDGLLVALKVSALQAVIVTDNNATGESPFDDDRPIDLKPGSVVHLPGGVDISTLNPQGFSQSQPLLASVMRQIAAGFGLPTHLVDGDLSQANFSSLRAGNAPFHQRIRQFQHGTLKPQLLSPVWNRVNRLGVLSGRLAAGPDFETNPRAYLSAHWTYPAFPALDALKQTQADAAEVAAGFKSRTQAVAERGRDVQALDREIAQENADASALGLHFIDPTAPEDNSQ